ncbi:MAG TPA: hypothetical protein GYA10_07910 [Alphaproteobacteria bacterium]|nr:hypothetical protein [Alphaproteobacteria bacterium]
MVNLNNPDALTVSDESQSPPRFHHLAAWRHARDGAHSPLWEAALAARGALSDFFTRRKDILADERRSDRAKQDDTRAAALEALRELGDAQRRLNTSAEETRADRLKLAGVAPASPADAIADLDIARHFRSLGERDRQVFLQALVSGQEPRAVDAVLRLPGFLFGLTPEMVAIIRVAAVEREHPKEVGRLRSLDEAAQTAQHVLKRCAAILEESTALSLEDLMRGYGDGAWQHFVQGPRAPLEALARLKYGVGTAAE